MESTYGLYSYYGVVNCNIVSGSEDTFVKPSPFRLGLSGVWRSNLQHEGQDVFVLPATGKSPCYQTLPFLMEHNLGGSKAILVVSWLLL